MVSGLLSALVIIAIVSLIGWGIIAVVPMPPQVKTVLWVVIGVFCLLFLLDALSGVSIR